MRKGLWARLEPLILQAHGRSSASWFTSAASFYISSLFSPVFSSSFLKISPLLSILKTLSGSKTPESTFFLFTCNWIQTRNKFPQKTVYLPKEITSIVISNYANPLSHFQHVASVLKNSQHFVWIIKIYVHAISLLSLFNSKENITLKQRTPSGQIKMALLCVSSTQGSRVGERRVYVVWNDVYL